MKFKDSACCALAVHSAFTGLKQTRLSQTFTQQGRGVPPQAIGSSSSAQLSKKDEITWIYVIVKHNHFLIKKKDTKYVPQ